MFLGWRSASCGEWRAAMYGYQSQSKEKMWSRSGGISTLQNLFCVTSWQVSVLPWCKLTQILISHTQSSSSQDGESHFSLVCHHTQCIQQHITKLYTWSEKCITLKVLGDKLPGKCTCKSEYFNILEENVSTIVEGLCTVTLALSCLVKYNCKRCLSVMI